VYRRAAVERFLLVRNCKCTGAPQAREFELFEIASVRARREQEVSEFSRESTKAAVARQVGENFKIFEILD
jgi:hypothetical protein